MKSYISIFILALSLFAVAASCKTKKSARKTTAQKTENVAEVPTAAGARKDIKNNQVKYYSFGIAAPTPQFISAMQSRYHITVISNGCVVDDELMAYNAVVDSFMKAKYHKSVADVREEGTN